MIILYASEILCFEETFPGLRAENSLFSSKQGILRKPLNSPGKIRKKPSIGGHNREFKNYQE
jgi:hypothetical protein